MCGLSEAALFHASILFTGDSPAKTSALQDVVSAWKASEADYFSRCSGSLTNASQPLFSSKTSQQLGPVELNEFAKNWPAVGMISGGTLYPLRKSELRTLESDGSCLLPTPSALWPTPKASDSNPCGMMAMLRYNMRTGRKTLITEVAKNLWPTPRASDGSNGGPNQRGSKGDLALPAAVHHWATPTARDWKSGSMGTQGNSRPLSEQVGGQLNPTFVEFLMGYPRTWTKVEDWARLWLKKGSGTKNGPTFKE